MSGMGIETTYHRFEDMLMGWPSGALTLVLLALAFVLIVIALRASALEKGIVAAWVLFP